MSSATRRLRLVKESLAPLASAEMHRVVGGHSHVWTLCAACRDTSFEGCPPPPTIPLNDCV